MMALDEVGGATAPRRWRGPARIGALAFLLALACNDHPISGAPPSDRFYFPTGLALRHEPPGCTAGTAGCRTQLLVVSSNFDLAYDATRGGTLISVDVDQALAQAALPGAPSPLPAPVLGGVRIGSFGGELAIVDPETCPNWTGPAQALVASRSQLELYRVDLDDQGGLTCGDGCVVPLDPTYGDPYGVTVACGSLPASVGAAPSPQTLAFVSFLRSVNAEGWFARVDLRAADANGLRTSPITNMDVGLGPTGHSEFDPAAGRLYVTGRFSAIGYAPLRWLELAAPALPYESVNVFSVIRGADLRGMALSSDRTRAYVAIRLYDPSGSSLFGGGYNTGYNDPYAGSYGMGYGMGYGLTYSLRPYYDLAGALAVVDLTALEGAVPALRILQIVPLDRGASEVRVLPRTGRGDLVVVTASDDSTVTLFDDDTGLVAKTFAVCDAAVEPGAPACNPGSAVMGANPFGLAVEPLANGLARVYIGSFDRGWINLLQIDPMHPEVEPSLWIRIGAEMRPDTVPGAAL